MLTKITYKFKEISNTVTDMSYISKTTDFADVFGGSLIPYIR